MKRIPLALLFGLAGQAQAIPENSSLFCAERPSSPYPGIEPMTALIR